MEKFTQSTCYIIPLSLGVNVFYKIANSDLAGISLGFLLKFVVIESNLSDCACFERRKLIPENSNELRSM